MVDRVRMRSGDVWTGCALLLACACAFVAAGFFFLAEANHHARGVKVRAYDESVQSWTRGGRDTFSRAAFVMNLSWPGGHMEAPLGHAVGDEPVMADDGADLPKYAPLRFEWQGALPSASSGWSELPLSVTLSGSSAASSGERCAPVALATQIPLGYTDSLRLESHQHCVAHHGGSYASAEGVCVTWHALAELCVRVKRRGHCWVPVGGEGGTGCQPGRDGEWALGAYTLVRGRRAGGAWFHREPPAEAARPVLRVREAADPRVVALNVTGGTLRFGTSDTVKAIGGLELLLIGAALGTPALVFFCGRLWPRGGRRVAEAAEVRFSALATTELVPVPAGGPCAAAVPPSRGRIPPREAVQSPVARALDEA